MTEFGEKIFILGLGSQKCGTTWLYNYILNSGQADMGFCKEYHIWDALYGDSIQRTKESYFINPGARSSLKFLTQAARYHMLHTFGFYEEYFRKILNFGHRITGDITPSYCALTREKLKLVRSRLLNIAGLLRVVFLMRDPFERCLSQARMYKGMGLFQGDSALTVLANNFRSQEYQVRTRYEITHRNICETFNEEELYCGLYERMFQTENIEKISEFLTLESDTSFADRHFNQSPKVNEIPIELAKSVQDFYAETYSYVEHHFPEASQLWKRY